MKVGDVIALYKDQYCPCEMLVLDFEGENCTYDMSLIDGSTAFRNAQALKVTKSNPKI